MAKRKRQNQRSNRPAANQTTPRRAGGQSPSRQSITTGAQQAQRRQELLKWLGTGLLLAVFAVVALIVINQMDDDSSDSNGNVATVVAAAPLPDGVQQNGNVLGDPNAPVLIVEYGDYQCPFCKKFADDDMPTLIDEYLATGKARLEFRQFPIIGRNSDGSIDQSGESFHAAEAAACALDQGKFWEMHDLLYENSLGEFKGSFTIDRLKKIAALIPGLDAEAFGSCLDRGNHTQDILASASDGQDNGVNSTPTFIVGDQIVSGANYDRLKAAIDAQLDGE